MAEAKVRAGAVWEPQPLEKGDPLSVVSTSNEGRAGDFGCRSWAEAAVLAWSFLPMEADPNS